MGLDRRRDLAGWLAPFLSVLGHEARARVCPPCVAGLIGIGERKSIQPMALRDGSIGHDRSPRFVGAGVRDAAPPGRELARRADALSGGDEAFPSADDTALPKKGARSVGVAPRYASALGKNANRRTLASLTLAKAEVPAMVGLRLFLPESWTGDETRLAKAGVPEGRRAYRTKPEIAVDEVDRVRAAGVRFGCVLAGAGYGLSAPFRRAPSARGLRRAVGIPHKQKVYPADVAMIFPVAGRGRPRKRHVPDVASIPARTMLAAASWRELSWRRGVKGKLQARFAATRARVADGAPRRVGGTGARHPPGEEAWPIGERRSSGERKCYPSNMPAGTPLERLAGVVKARRVREQAHQRMKEGLGLDRFEGRSWQGLRRHAPTSAIASLFLRSRRPAEAKRGKKKPATSTVRSAPKPAGCPRRPHPGVRTVATGVMPAPRSSPALP